jgi:6-phosphogluconolactonase
MFTRSTHSFTFTRRVLLTGLLSLVSLASPLARGAQPPDDDRWSGGGRGAVFTLTNSPSGNAVVAYRRAANGALQVAGSFATGGVGTGAGLFSQDAIVVTDDRRFVLAVNAGSNSISVFRIRQDGLQLVGTAPSGGVMPTSIAVRNGLVVVLNAGEPNNITGFFMGPLGRLYQIPGFTRPLSAPQTSPAQVGFSHDGDTLIITERATSQISTFSLDGFGVDGPYLTPSAGPTPFGFAVGSRNTVLVSEAGAGGGASTYRVRRDRLTSVSSAIMTGQRAACWAVLTPDGRFGYVSNAGTGNISGFAIGRDGSAELLDADGVTAVTGGNPTDMAMSDDGRYLYARVANLNAIAVLRVGRDGALTTLPSLSGTPAGLAGLAGF